jgi:alpha-galactosidase
MSIKISIIGAGSAIFSLSLIKDICLCKNLHGSTITFMDISRERLDTAFALCSRYAEEIKIKLNLEKTMDRKTALKGSDFVINTALAAGHHKLAAGWNIAKKFGYRFGGSLHVMHDEAFWVNYYQLKLMEDVLKDVLRICPKAWYILVANPVMAGTTFLKRKYPQANVVGMCHGFSGVYQLAKTLGFKRDDISYEIPGVNHFVWLNKFGYKGKDAFSILDRWIEKHYKNRALSGKPFYGLGSKFIDLYKRFGVYPIGDTGSWGGGSWGYWYHGDKKTEQSWNEDPEGSYQRHLKHCEEFPKKMEAAAFDTSKKVSEVFGTQESGEPMIPLIEGLAYDTYQKVVVNIMNDGEFVAGVPNNFEVEVPAIISKKGIQGIKTKPLPTSIQAFILRDYVAPTEIELEAYSKGSREGLLKLILMDPWTKSEKQAKDLLKAILAMPFHEEMRKHYQ